jgi:predicted secreted hydrolase
VRESARWKSPRTGAEYPARWEVEIPGHGIAVRVVPAFAAQENVASRAGLHYWEGAVRVEDRGGAVAGEGYVELTGYGEKNRPPL